MKSVSCKYCGALIQFYPSQHRIYCSHRCEGLDLGHRKWFSSGLNLKMPQANYKMKPWYQPNLEPSPSLVYLLGVLQGDGSVRSHTSLVSLSVRNREFVEAFADGLEKIGLRPHFRSYRHRGKDWYSVQTRSVVFAKWYRGLSISDIAQMAILFPSEYVRGFYESEGYDDGHRGQTLCNSSPEKLELIRRCLLNLGFSTSLVKPYLFPNGKIKNKKTMYRVRIYGGRQQRLNFIEKIKPCIKMKGGDAHAA